MSTARLLRLWSSLLHLSLNGLLGWLRPHRADAFHMLDEITGLSRLRTELYCTELNWTGRCCPFWVYIWFFEKRIYIRYVTIHIHILVYCIVFSLSFSIPFSLGFTHISLSLSFSIAFSLDLIRFPIHAHYAFYYVYVVYLHLSHYMLKSMNSLHVFLYLVIFN